MNEVLKCYQIYIGYDKLKPYGFPIHGPIDGYSRKILWLELTSSNNRPEIPANYYLECVKENFGCPMIVRTDCGTENGTMAAIQAYFRQHGNNQFAGSRSHIYGTSPSNQRIEAWWSYYRRGRSSWWIDFFKQITATEVLDIGSEFHLECLCFQSILQADLDQVPVQFPVYHMYCSTFHIDQVLWTAKSKLHKNKLMPCRSMHKTFLMRLMYTKNTFIMSWAVKNYLIQITMLKHVIFLSI